MQKFKVVLVMLAMVMRFEMPSFTNYLGNPKGVQIYSKLEPPKEAQNKRNEKKLK